MSGSIGADVPFTLLTGNQTGPGQVPGRFRGRKPGEQILRKCDSGYLRQKDRELRALFPKTRQKGTGGSNLPLSAKESPIWRISRSSDNLFRTHADDF